MGRRRLQVRGAREHNLADVSLDLDMGQWISVTGPSGSGKTSLVFATIVAESQRRYLSTLSARARHLLTRVGRPEVDAIVGLPVAIAVGQADARGNPRSTVGTLTGVLDLLRLWFAREARDPGGASLTRSHFSFNHPVGACPTCSGLGLVDAVDPALLVAHPDRSIRDGALTTTLKNGYTVYSQVTLEVMDQICRAHGFDVDTPWAALSEAQRDVIMCGTDAIEVPFGKHSIESRMRWKGIQAKPRELGHYRGLVPVIEEILRRDRNPGVLRFVRSTPCEVCDGARLDRPGREAHIDGCTLPSLLAMPVRRLRPALAGLPHGPVAKAVADDIDTRLHRLERLSLDHLSLARVSTTLSGGEAQRVRLAGQLATGLSGMLVCLDEPTLGLHPEAGEGMAAMLDEVVAAGNTLVVVEHDPDMVRRCDHLVEVGPGAGPHGGHVVSQGPPSTDPLGPPPVPRRERRGARDALITLRGASLHNLRDATLRIRGRALNVVIGPAGAGKSSLVFQTLLPALTGAPAGPYASLEGAPAGAVRALDARPPGKTARSTPATYSGIFDLIRERFAAEPAAQAAGYGPGRFSYNNKDGRCSTCEGLGTLRIGLHLMADAKIECPACEGRRYDPATLEVRHRGLDVAEVLALSVDEALVRFADDPPVAALAGAMSRLGLGYLQLGQPSASLSRGEAQRLKLATVLGREGDPALILLDEPDRGLHPDDVARLVAGVDALVDAGHTVLAISHHRHLWAAADALTEVRDGATREVHFDEFTRLSEVRPPRAPLSPPVVVSLRGVTHHNLRGVDLELPHDALTVVAGVSGSGKSSLIFDALVGEAWRRFAESLPFSARRHVRQRPRAAMDGASGLRPAVALAQGQPRAPRRSTVATQSELGPLLRTLWSRAGTLDGAPCSMSAEHFSPDRPLGACTTCEGSGEVGRCDPSLLLTHPDRPLTDGAARGTAPGKLFTDPNGQHMATLRAALATEGLEGELAGPWNAMADRARHVALRGLPDRALDVRWKYARGGRKGEHRFEATWEGLCALVEAEARRRAGNKAAAKWTTTLRQVECPACEGHRLAAAPARVELDGTTLPELLDLPLSRVPEVFAAFEIDDPRRRVALDAFVPQILDGVLELCALGLGHLSLSRRSATLSEGERQRVRLAGVARAQLTSSIVVLDEPGAGLHPRQLEALLERLRQLRDRGNTVVVVSHRPAVIAAADHLVELGPGPGAAGGRIVACGPPDAVLAGDSPTAKALREPSPARPDARPPTFELRGATTHNLRGIDVRMPARGVVAVTGPSGSGKSTLVFEVLGPSVEASAPVGCDGLSGVPAFDRVITGRGPLAAGTPLTALDLMKPLQKLYADAAGPDGPPARAFSFASPAGRCPRCKGSGLETISLDVLADLALPCPACHGARYRDEVLEVRWRGMNVAELLERPVAELPDPLPDPLRRGVAALEAVGLGHLALGRASSSLSGGEAQRVQIAAALPISSGSTRRGKAPNAASSPRLVLLDEPAAGQHESDLTRIAAALRQLADAGDLVVITEHRARLIDAADWVIELGPGGGPEGGRLLRQGAP